MSKALLLSCLGLLSNLLLLVALLLTRFLLDLLSGNVTDILAGDAAAGDVLVPVASPKLLLVSGRLLGRSAADTARCMGASAAGVAGDL
jgi:hypothetical protein